METWIDPLRKRLAPPPGDDEVGVRDGSDDRWAQIPLGWWRNLQEHRWREVGTRCQRNVQRESGQNGRGMLTGAVTTVAACTPGSGRRRIIRRGVIVRCDPVAPDSDAGIRQVVRGAGDRHGRACDKQCQHQSGNTPSCAKHADK